MRPARTLIAIVGTALLSVPAQAPAQEPVRDFTQLNTRLKPGDKVWVTDSQGREVKGSIGSITAETIALEASAAPAYRAGEVRLVQRRDPARRIWAGAAVGAIAGLGVGIAACAAYPKDDPLRGDACLMSIGLMWMPGLGAGALVGSILPGKKVAVYRAPGSSVTRPARLSIAPVITPRAKGVAVDYSF